MLYENGTCIVESVFLMGLKSFQKSEAVRGSIEMNPLHGFNDNGGEDAG